MTQFTAANAVVRITADDRGLTQAQGRVRRALGEIGQQMRRVALLGSAVFITAGAGALKLASDAEETAAKFDTVFGPAADRTRQRLAAFADEVGRSRFELEEMASRLGALLVPMGFGQQAAGDLSVRLSQLATDLASFNNISEQEALTALFSGLVGEAEPLRRLGVQLSAARVETEAFTSGIARQGEELTEVQKAQARLNIIFADTQQAQGDAARTSESFTNQMRALRSRVRDTATEFGQNLIPAATEFLQKVNAILPSLASFAAANAEAIIKVGALTVAIGGLTLALPVLFTPLGALSAALVALAVNFLGASDAGAAFGDTILRLAGQLGIIESAALDAQDAQRRFSDAGREAAEIERQLAAASDPVSRMDALNRLISKQRERLDLRKKEIEALRREAEERRRAARATIEAIQDGPRSSQFGVGDLTRLDDAREQLRRAEEDIERIGTAGNDRVVQQLRDQVDELQRQRAEIVKAASESPSLDGIADAAATAGTTFLDLARAARDALIAGATEVRDAIRQQVEDVRQSVFDFTATPRQRALFAAQQQVQQVREAQTGGLITEEEARRLISLIVDETERRLSDIAGAGGAGGTQAPTIGNAMDIVQQFQQQLLENSQDQRAIRAAEKTADNTAKAVSAAERQTNILRQIESFVRNLEPGGLAP